MVVEAPALNPETARPLPHAVVAEINAGGPTDPRNSEDAWAMPDPNQGGVAFDPAPILIAVERLEALAGSA